MVAMSMRFDLRHLVERFALASLLALAVAFLPLPLWTPVWFVYVQVPLTVLLLICYLGKLLVDTLFYPRLP
jgi:hypothetical protein